MEYALAADRNLINTAQCHGILKRWRPPCAPAERVVRIMYVHLGARTSNGPGKSERRLEAKKQVYVIENSRNSTSIGQMYEVNRPS